MRYDYRVILRVGKILHLSSGLKFREFQDLLDRGTGCYAFRDKRDRVVVLKVSEIVGFRVENMSQ
jgi:hypothetical protein